MADQQELERGIHSQVAERRLDGLYKQRGGNNFVMLRVRRPGGQWKTGHLSVVTALAEQFGDGQLHFTTRGDIEFHDVDFNQVNEVIRRLLKAGLSTRGACGDSVRNIVACPGTGICPNELIDVGQLVAQIALRFTEGAAFEELPRKFKISVSGCQRACAFPQIQDLGLVARKLTTLTKPGEVIFEIFLAGGLGRYPLLARKIPATIDVAEVLDFIRATLECFNEMGERQHRHRARMKFLAEKIGHEALLHHITERMVGETWDFQI